jgi:hypothetical protein
MAPATLRIRLLGELDLRLGEDPLPPLGSARAESLLAYLLLHREAAQPRQRLAFLLWPDSSEPQARTNLRHLLHVLRRALPDADRFLEVTPRALRWREDAPWWLDVAAFEEALARASREPAEEVPALRRALRGRPAPRQLRRLAAGGAGAAPPAPPPGPRAARRAAGGAGRARRGDRVRRAAPA